MSQTLSRGGNGLRRDRAGEARETGWFQPDRNLGSNCRTIRRRLSILTVDTTARGVAFSRDVGSSPYLEGSRASRLAVDSETASAPGPILPFPRFGDEVDIDDDGELDDDAVETADAPGAG